MSTRSAFKNQRPAFRNPSPPYAEKSLENPRWLVPSRKNGRQVHCWTAGEYRAAVAFETASPFLIHSYEERPELVQLRDGPEWYRYTPHFRVELASGPVVLELSHFGQPRTPRQMIVAGLAKRYYTRKAVRFLEMPHRQLAAQPRAKGADLLIRYLSSVPTTEEVMRARDVLASGPASIARVEAASNVRRECLLAMARRGELQLVSPPPIGLESLIALSSVGGWS